MWLEQVIELVVNKQNQDWAIYGFLLVFVSLILLVLLGLRRPLDGKKVYEDTFTLILQADEPEQSKLFPTVGFYLRERSEIGLEDESLEIPYWIEFQVAGNEGWTPKKAVMLEPKYALRKFDVPNRGLIISSHDFGLIAPEVDMASFNEPDEYGLVRVEGVRVQFRKRRSSVISTFWNHHQSDVRISVRITVLFTIISLMLTVAWDFLKLLLPGFGY